MCVNDIETYTCGHSKCLMQDCPQTTVDARWTSCSLPAVRPTNVEHDCEDCVARDTVIRDESSNQDSTTGMESMIQLPVAEAAADTTATKPCITPTATSTNLNTPKRNFVPPIAMAAARCQYSIHNSHANGYICGHSAVSTTNYSLPGNASRHPIVHPGHSFGVELLNTFCPGCHRIVWNMCSGEIQKQHVKVHEQGNCKCGFALTDEEKTMASAGRGHNGVSMPAEGWASWETDERMKRMYLCAVALWNHKHEIDEVSVEQAWYFVDAEMREEREKARALRSGSGQNAVQTTQPFNGQLHSNDQHHGSMLDRTPVQLSIRQDASQAMNQGMNRGNFQESFPASHGIIRLGGAQPIDYFLVPVVSSQEYIASGGHQGQIGGPHQNNIFQGEYNQGPGGYQAHGHNGHYWTTSAQATQQYFGYGSPTPAPRNAPNQRYQNMGSYERYDTRQQYLNAEDSAVRRSNTHPIVPSTFADWSFPARDIRTAARPSVNAPTAAEIASTSGTFFSTTPRVAHGWNVLGSPYAARRASGPALNATSSNFQTPGSRQPFMSFSEITPPISAPFNGLTGFANFTLSKL